MSKMRLLLLLLFSMLTACDVSPESALPTTTAATAIAVSNSASPTVVPVTSTLVSSPPPTSTPLPTRYATRRPTITTTPTEVAPTRTPTVTPTSVPVVAAPPGLIYSDSKGQWRIGANGNPTLIISDTDALISPNYQMAIVSSECCACGCDHKRQLVNLISGNTRLLEPSFWYGEWSQDSHHFYYIATGKNDLSDIWVEDAITGEKRNLSKTPDRHEGQLSIWPNQTDYLFFYSWPTDVIADGEGWHGYPTVMKTDGTEYQVISNDLGTGLLALSPDGRTIVFSDWEHAWYYRRGEGTRLFPWRDFGLTGLKNVRFHSPSWSSAGQRIAWSMSGEDRSGHVDGVSIFDLQAGTARFIRNWSHVEWSPDQRWIIGLRDGSVPGNKYGVWVANANFENAHLLTEVFNSIDGECSRVWSPDENWLAFNCVNAVDAALNDGIWLAELETGKLLKTNLPDDAQIHDWVNPQP
jgi:hypothetical protein